MTDDLLTVRTYGSGLSRIGAFADANVLSAATQRFLRYYAVPLGNQIDILQFNIEREEDGYWPGLGTYKGIVDLPPKVGRISIYVKRRHSEKRFWQTFYHELDHLFWDLEQPDYIYLAHISYERRSYEVRARKRGEAWMYRHLLFFHDISKQPGQKKRWWEKRNLRKAWQKL